jgi:hypothetical protein
MPSTSEACRAYYGEIKHLLNCITLVSFTTIYMMHGTMKTKFELQAVGGFDKTAMPLNLRSSGMLTQRGLVDN